MIAICSVLLRFIREGVRYTLHLFTVLVCKFLLAPQSAYRYIYRNGFKLQQIVFFSLIHTKCVLCICFLIFHLIFVLVLNCIYDSIYNLRCINIENRQITSKRVLDWIVFKYIFDWRIFFYFLLFVFFFLCAHGTLYCRFSIRLNNL